MNQANGIASLDDCVGPKARRSAIVLASYTVVAVILIGILPATISAKGRCWTVTFGDDADGDGGNHQSGLAYGTDDNGLTCSVKYGRRAPNYIMLPVLSGWGVTILALLILVAATAVLRRRRLRA